MATRPQVLSICSGVGMLDLGLRLAVDARTVLYVEREIPSVQILARRMEDGTIDAAPVWSDLTTLDARGLRGVDILAGGIPCQPFSCAGERRGNEDHRALAPHVLRLVSECVPSVVFIENVPPWVLLGYARGFLGGLSDMGYRIAEPFFCRASDLGAPHRRERVFVMAYRESCERSLFLQWRRSFEADRQLDRSGGEVAESSSLGCERGGPARHGGGGSSDDGGPMGDAESTEWRPHVDSDANCGEGVDDEGQAPSGPRESSEGFPSAWPPGPKDDWSDIDPDLWPATEPHLRRVADGSSSRIHRLRALGNGVVPIVVATAFRALVERCAMKTGKVFKA